MTFSSNEVAYISNEGEGTDVEVSSPIIFSQAALNDLVRDLNLPKDKSQLLGSSERSFKAVLLHDTNQYAPTPFGHSVCLNESYEIVKTILNAVEYNHHNWKVCGVFKIISMLFGQQAGYTKYPCFIYLWNSRDKNQNYKKIFGLFGDP